MRVEWSVPPFAGVVKDGYVWGCGATDMKNQVAAEAVALARLKRSGASFAGTVKYAATADEEDGEFCGVQWLCEHRPDALRADYCLNEGMGGLWLPVDGRKVFLLAVGEKAFAQFRIRTRGRGGHGSVPEKEHSAVIDLARAVSALGLSDPPAIVSGTTARFIDASSPTPGLRARLKDPRPRAPPAPSCAGSTRSWPGWSSRSSAPRSPPRCSPPARRSTSSPRAPKPASIAASFPR